MGNLEQFSSIQFDVAADLNKPLTEDTVAKSLCCKEDVRVVRDDFSLHNQLQQAAEQSPEQKHRQT